MPEETTVHHVSDDWTVVVTERLEGAVEGIQQKVTVPLITVARAVVFGVVSGVLSAAALVLIVIGITRVLLVYIPIHPEARRVWIVYTAVAAIFLIAGAFLWSMRVAKPRH